MASTELTNIAGMSTIVDKLPENFQEDIARSLLELSRTQFEKSIIEYRKLKLAELDRGLIDQEDYDEIRARFPIVSLEEETLLPPLNKITKKQGAKKDGSNNQEYV